MMPDIFSSFDPHMYNTLYPSNSMFLVLNTLAMMIIQASFWITMSRMNGLKAPIKSLIFTQLSRTSSLNLKGVSTIMSSVFIMLI